MAALLLLTTACGGPVSTPPPGASPATPPPPVSRKPEPAPSSAAGLGLQPLPSPAQVSAAVSLGRPDPFLDPRPPVVSAPAAGPAVRSQAAGASAGAGSPSQAPSRPAGPPAAPADFQFNGLIQSRGRIEALVQYRGEAGTVAEGDRGGAANPLLPAGWRVQSIDPSAGVLRLETGRGVVRIPLSQEDLG